MNVHIPKCRPDRVRRLTERYGISLLLATILERRGVEEKDIIYYLEDEFIYQHSPFTVEDVFTACDRIDEAIKDEEKILIFGDRDVDGITSTAILYRTLKKVGAKNLHYRLPEGDESYGLTSDIVREILDGGYTLVITVDNGITANSEILELEKRGVSVIVTDHHIPSMSLPPATAIFDPKVEGSGYPYEHLAGCAVAAKLAWAILFSRTPLYGSDLILLHAEPANGTVRISAVRLENLVEIDRISEEVLEGTPINPDSRLMRFLACSLPIIVLDSATETAMLRRAFGKSVDISLTDFRPQLERVMPQAKGKTLFELSVRSRAARYAFDAKELETLISLFRSVSIYSYPELSREFEDIMQLEAIGTIADLMPMTGENRLIVKKGLKLLTGKPSLAFPYLFSKQNLIGKKLVAKDISYKVSPVINAAGRMGKPAEALKLLLTHNFNEAEDLTDILLSLNSDRQDMEEDALSLVMPKAQESFEEHEGRMIIVEDDRVPRGLTGALSSKILNEFGAPALVMATMDDRISASMRCRDPWNARSFLGNFAYYFEDYGGHRYAAGFSMKKENLDEFLSAVKAHLESEPLPDLKDVVIEADAEIPAQFMDSQLWEISDILEPYGQENEVLKLYIRGALIEDVYQIGSGESKYLRMTIRFGNHAWSAIWWDCPDRSLYDKGMKADLVFTPEYNYWKGQMKEQLIIHNLEIVE